MVWRYWCDFCRKGGCAGWAIKQHEEHCTLNPNRSCRMCAQQPRFKSPGLEYLRMLARNDADELRGSDWALEPETSPQKVVDRMIDEAGGCPACVLAALRQTGRTRCHEGESAWMAPFPFDFKKESAAFFQSINERDDYNDMMANCY